MNTLYLSDPIPEISYVRLPLFLVEDIRYDGLSPAAKIIYSLILRRCDLSRKNDWQDKKGRLYVYFTIAEVMRTVNCCRQKAVNILKELEYSRLITRHKQGLGKPDRILCSIPTDL